MNSIFITKRTAYLAGIASALLLASSMTPASAVQVGGAAGNPGSQGSIGSLGGNVQPPAPPTGPTIVIPDTVGSVINGAGNLRSGPSIVVGPDTPHNPGDDRGNDRVLIADGVTVRAGFGGGPIGGGGEGEGGGEGGGFSDAKVTVVGPNKLPKPGGNTGGGDTGGGPTIPGDVNNQINQINPGNGQGPFDSGTAGGGLNDLAPAAGGNAAGGGNIAFIQCVNGVLQNVSDPQQVDAYDTCRNLPQ